MGCRFPVGAIGRANDCVFQRPEEFTVAFLRYELYAGAKTRW